MKNETAKTVKNKTRYRGKEIHNRARMEDEKVKETQTKGKIAKINGIRTILKY